MRDHSSMLAVMLAAFLGVAPAALKAGPASLEGGKVYDLKIPDNLKDNGTNEGYFYTHGPVTVFAYEYPCQVTIRNPMDPEDPIVSTDVPLGMRFYDTTLPAGFYYISVTKPAGVVVGVTDTDKCNGYYHYRSSGDAYDNVAVESEWYFRTTDGCGGRAYVFSPAGESAGHYCPDTNCLGKSITPYTTSASSRYFRFGPSNWHGYLEVESGHPVSILNRDGPGYYVPPYSIDSGTQSFFYTYYEENEYLNIHSFADGAEVEVLSLTLPEPLNLIWSGTLDEGETHSIEGHFSFDRRIVKVITTKGQSSVSVLGGSAMEANDNYRTHVLDPAGNMQGTDFITRHVSGAYLLVTGLDNGTTVEVRNAGTGALQEVHTLNQAQVWTVPLPAADAIWRVRADKDITVSAFKGHGATFIPLTRNTTGSHPFPPAISRPLVWEPLHPRTTDDWLTVRWLTDELATTMLHYSMGGGPWLDLSQTGDRMEHSRSIDLRDLDEETEVRFWVEAADQSGMTTVEDNDGVYYTVTVRDVVPEVEVEFLDYTFQDGYYDVRFAIRNNGLASARNVKVKFDIEGFQPFSDGVDSSYGLIMNERIKPTLTIDELYPEWTTHRRLKLMPFLSDWGDVDYRIREVTSEGEDEWGNPISGTHPEGEYEFDRALIESRLRDTRYVIVANLFRLFSFYPDTEPDAQTFARRLAAFASARNAVLAYVTTDAPVSIEAYVDGCCGGKIDPAWHDGGYLLLVGNQAALMSFDRRIRCGAITSYVWLCDNEYGNVDSDSSYTPELCVGRVTGTRPSHYTALLDRALSPIDHHKALCISGTGNGENTFWGNVEDCFDRLVSTYLWSLKQRLGDYADSEHVDFYRRGCPNTDFLYYRNHGGHYSFDNFGDEHVDDITFGGKSPIVYANACHTGDINYRDCIGEQFLIQHAAVFIGATQVSPRYKNNTMGERVTGNYRDGLGIGRSFRDAKRAFGGEIGRYTECNTARRKKEFILMYNLYGDPARGAPYSDLKAAKEATAYDTPIDRIEISVPMYEVETDELGFDHVTLPDEEHGDTMSEDNEPIVPSYRWSAVYPPGIRVNGISLSHRGVVSMTDTLVLPTSWGYEESTPGPDDVPSPGTFPKEDFAWAGIERPDGGLEVELQVYPFFYNAETQDATFYQEFEFDVDWSVSTVFVSEVTPEDNPVPLGEQQQVSVAMVNRGTTEKTVDMDVEIAVLGGGDVAAMLSANGIPIGASEEETRSFTWATLGETEGDYQVTVRLQDSNSGDECDVAYAQFRLGVPRVDIRSVTFSTSTPGYVRDPEDVSLGMEIECSGDVPVSGTMYVEIRRDTDGLLLLQSDSSFEELAPGATQVYGQVWNSSGIEDGDYRFLCWAEYSGGVTPVSAELFSTLKRMRMEWSLPKDVYRHGDKIFATGNLYERDGTPTGLADRAGLAVLKPDLGFFQPELSEHGHVPNYSSSFVVTAASPTGLYGLVYDATKTGYRYTAGAKGFVVTDHGFAMGADPPVCIADGMTSITVTSEVVDAKKAAIPDGTLMTVTPWFGGKVTTEDADPGTPGRQIASSGGRFQFVWQSPQHTALEAFVYGRVLGTDPPQSGVSARFKGIDVNDNRCVDVQDVLFIQSSQENVLGAPNYDLRKDLNEDDVVDSTDTNQVVDRWPLELSGSIQCPTCVPETGTQGVVLRPVPDRATISPGGNLTVEVVVDSVDDLGAYEFTCALTGDALVWSGSPEQSSVLDATGNTQHPLGPIGYDWGYRIGAYASGAEAGPGGRQTLCTLRVSANQIGESHLILSVPMIVRSDGARHSILRAVEGIYEVAEVTPTPTPTLTVAPTATGTPGLTPTPTGTHLPGDTNGDNEINALDLFHFCHFWKEPASAADERCNPVIERANDTIDAKDLLFLLNRWME